jgi:DNA-binding CsgD family transcriptional regulator
MVNSITLSLGARGKINKVTKLRYPENEKLLLGKCVWSVCTKKMEKLKVKDAYYDGQKTGAVTFVDITLNLRGAKGHFRIHFAPWEHAESRHTDLVCARCTEIPAEMLSLTDRQREIFCMVAYGDTEDQIVKALDLKLSTVRSQMSRISLKLGEHRKDMIRLVHIAGWY